MVTEKSGIFSTYTPSQLHISLKRSIRLIRYALSDCSNGKLLDDAKADKTFSNEYDEGDVDYPGIFSSKKFPERYETLRPNDLLQKIERNLKESNENAKKRPN